MFKPPVFPNLPVLLVDDSAFARRILRGMLESVGLRHVIEAGDGGEALNRMAQFKPSLIILDWNLPVLDAKGVLDVLRDPSASTETAVPVIIMTASPTRRLIGEAASRNVRHVLKKPFAPKMLWQRISSFFDEDPSNVADMSPRPLLNFESVEGEAGGGAARRRLARPRL